MDFTCQDCPPPPPQDFMLFPPPPPPLQELCHYQGDCSHHPVISNLHSDSSIINAIVLVIITSLTVSLVIVVSCIIILRYNPFSLNFTFEFLTSDFICKNRRRKSVKKQETADLYKQVNCGTLSRDVKIQELNLANYNYYISDRDSVGDHIYEVIDDCYEAIGPPLASAPCSCMSGYQAPSGNVYIRKPQHFNDTNNPLVSVRFDSDEDWQVQRDNHQRHFNSVKTFKTQRKFT